MDPSVIFIIMLAWIVFAQLAMVLRDTYMRRHDIAHWDNNPLSLPRLVRELFMWWFTLPWIGYQVELQVVRRQLAAQDVQWSTPTWRWRKAVYFIKNIFFWWATLYIEWYQRPRWEKELKNLQRQVGTAMRTLRNLDKQTFTDRKTVPGTRHPHATLDELRKRMGTLEQRLGCS